MDYNEEKIFTKVNVNSLFMEKCSIQYGLGSSLYHSVKKITKSIFINVDASPNRQ